MSSLLLIPLAVIVWFLCYGPLVADAADHPERSEARTVATWVDQSAGAEREPGEADRPMESGREGRGRAR